ncbi:hypothetical protein ZIOFF_061219 [Zingiber officinale]|uniref:Reverse transcriptase Ty1/copia-type domain-containing protein n=1 Tax=Zingiber officinale TaxID=94328 RepID=A0A8J5F430_ZINOF|nr:hypothetical protein ZIOFF_061219 [Zingiber officinale]
MRVPLTSIRVFPSRGVRASPTFLEAPSTSLEFPLAHLVNRQIVNSSSRFFELSGNEFAFVAAIYLINRMPKGGLPHMSSFEKLFTTVLDISKLRVFRCLYFPWLHPYSHDKLDPKSTSCVFLGDSLTQSAFLCYDVALKRVFVSRHVKFVEHIFPFAITSSLDFTAPRAWYLELRAFLVSLGFITSQADTSLFVYSRDDTVIYFFVYVDDLIIIGSDASSVDVIVCKLHAKFTIKDLGALSLFCGIEVRPTSNGLLLSQQKVNSSLHYLIDREVIHYFGILLSSSHFFYAKKGYTDIEDCGGIFLPFCLLIHAKTFFFDFSVVILDDNSVTLTACVQRRLKIVVFFMESWELFLRAKYEDAVFPSSWPKGRHGVLFHVQTTGESGTACGDEDEVAPIKGEGWPVAGDEESQCN